MFNILLDEKPTSWNGYSVNTDFRIGIQLMQIVQDKELAEREKTPLMLELLFPGIAPSDPNELTECVQWFLGGWYLDKQAKKKETARAFDFDVDQWRIYAAFRSQYNIDLNTVDLHFWEFMGLLTSLEECAFTRISNLRTQKIDPKMSKEEKQALKEAKRIYQLDDTEKVDNQREVDEALAIFQQAVKGNK